MPLVIEVDGAGDKQAPGEPRDIPPASEPMRLGLATPDMKTFADSIASEPGDSDAATFTKDLHERTAYGGKVAANTSFERQ